jgi:hypothetical protein
MPLLFYGRIEHFNDRRLYSKDLRPIESQVFDSFKINALAPYHRQADLANLWWFVGRNHTAVSWNECRIDITKPRGILENELQTLKEQTIFIPGFIDHIEALQIIRTEFPDYLVPGAIVFRFNNQEEAYRYRD